ncbi:MAG: YeeE/YedE family protein [Gammaproteobacteria bacterium]|nr:YeeE/YedE family protein [Gammaproteobacteria bacterium]MDH3859610.1 YeeE/YedE family protein [Gammaproteobacteria bacterium]
MEIDLYSQSLLWAFGLSVVFGAIANKANFCTMGAVSDWINIGDHNRMRSWLLAIAIATIGVGILEYTGSIDLSLTTSNETSNPPYRSANFIWLRHLVGGLMFGVGMTLASGCGNKTLVRLGEGNMKSVVVLTIMGIAAWWMLFTNFGYLVFLQWMLPVSIDFSNQGIPSQDIAAVLSGVTGIDFSPTLGFAIALLVAIPLLIWILRARDFRADLELFSAGFVIGMLIVIGWYVTSGPSGIALMEELEFMDERPFFTGAQSLTFIGPTGHIAQYLKEGFSAIFLTFGIATVVGVVVGSFLYTLIFRKVRIEWFVSRNDFVMHAIGGLLMGIGGVLGMGCTIGQGITGVSVLALGSILTIISIIAGSAATMKYQYYLMMREDD